MKFFCSVVLVLQVFSRPALHCQLVEAEVVGVLEIPRNDSVESLESSCDLTRFFGEFEEVDKEKLTSCSVASVVKFREQGSTEGVKFLQKIGSEKIFVDLTFTDFRMSHQKLLVMNKVLQKLKLSKNVNNKKLSHKQTLFNEKKIWKDLDDF